MTVSSTSSRSVFAGNGSAAEFEAPFKVLSADDLVVIYTDQAGEDFTLSPSQYGVTGLGADVGIKVTYPLSGTPIATGTRLTIYRDVAVTQPTSISNQGAMWPQVIERALDRLTYIAQKTGDAISRSLVVAPTDSASLATLPNAAQRANAFLAFDSAGQPVAATGIGLAAVSTWLANNFLSRSSRTASLAALGAGDLSGANTWSGANTFAGGLTGDGSGLSGILPAGLMAPFFGRAAPAGWLLCNGAAVSRTAWPALFAQLVRSSAVTFDVATDRVAWTAHGLWDGDPVKFSTTGALPGGISAGTIYYVRDAAAGDFKLAATPGGSAIDLTGTQSGIAAAVSAPAGDGDGSTTFTLPDWRGRTVIGHDAMGAAVAGRISFAGSGIYGFSLGATGGEQTHTLTAGEMPSHVHGLPNGSTGATSPGGGGPVTGTSPGNTTDAAGGGGAHNNVQPAIVWPVIIKT